MVGGLFCQDIPTQIFHWDFFKQSCKSKGVKPGKYLQPGVAEFLSGRSCNVRNQQVNVTILVLDTVYGFWSGLPTNWTQPVYGSVAVKDFLKYFPHLADKAGLQC